MPNLSGCLPQLRHCGCGQAAGQPDREHMEKYLPTFCHCSAGIQFQSTLPSRGATQIAVHTVVHVVYFNPRSPRGERRDFANGVYWGVQFQSTLPSRGATRSPPAGGLACNFNPRSPRGERLVFVVVLSRRRYFNPRSPRGERHFEPAHDTSSI